MPGFFPWYLNDDEVRFLTVALQQAMDVSLRFKKYPGLLVHPSKDHYFVRVPDKPGDDIIWKDEWLEPSALKMEDAQVIPVEETTLERIKKSTVAARRHLGDLFFLCTSGPAGKGRKTVFSLHESAGRPQFHLNS
jgi:hypothetical protein